MSKEDEQRSGDQQELDWIYRDSTKRMLMTALYVACAIAVLLELFVLKRKTKFDADWGFGFFAFVGFVSCTLMIFAAKGLGYILKVPTDFYDEKPEAEAESETGEDEK